MSWSTLPGLLLVAWLAGAVAEPPATHIKGKVSNSVDAFNFVALPAGTVTELVVRTPEGDAVRTFADREGWFTLRGVPPGRYVLTVQGNLRFIFPEYEVEVDKQGNLVRAAYLTNKVQIPHSPLVLRPMALAQYYEARKPLDVWGFVKSPYGLMIGFMLFGIIVFPKLKVDPEEYREAMAQLRGEEAPAEEAGSQQQQQRLRER